MKSRKWIWFVFNALLLIGYGAPSVAQNTGGNGFYVVIKSTRNCPNTLTSHDHLKSYCLPKEPVISSAEFASVTEIQYDSILQLKFMLLTLTRSGHKSIDFITKNLPDAQLALVIDNQVAGIFNNMDKNYGSTIKIMGGVNAPEVEWIHEKLKAH